MHLFSNERASKLDDYGLSSSALYLITYLAWESYIMNLSTDLMS